MTKYKVLQPFYSIHLDVVHTEGQFIEMEGYTAKDIANALATRLIEEVEVPKKTTARVEKKATTSPAINEEDSNGTSNST